MLPDPRERPLLKPDELVGLIPKMGRSAIYEHIKAGHIPSVTYGRRVFVVTAALLEQWGLTASDSSEGETAEVSPVASESNRNPAMGGHRGSECTPTDAA